MREILKKGAAPQKSREKGLKGAPGRCLKVVPEAQTELPLAVLEELVAGCHALEVLKAESQQVAIIFGPPLPSCLKDDVAAPIQGLEDVTVSGHEG